VPKDRDPLLPQPTNGNRHGDPRQGTPPLTVGILLRTQRGEVPVHLRLALRRRGTSDSKTPNHTYTDTARFDSLVTVTDADGKSAAATVSIYCGIPINPTITAVQKATNPFRLIIAGADFNAGCTIFVDGIQVPISQLKTATKVVAKGPGLKDMFPKRRPQVHHGTKSLGGHLVLLFVYR